MIMKKYLKPSFEVVTLNTAENIANNRLGTSYLKTVSGGAFGEGELKIVSDVKTLSVLS